ncbi:hypothetical protein, partial [Paenibacillus apiarius]|uniref:hypothetical protein n=1 Tax=Paenibacillus apiarius TaxID=46240 RepID=UPI003B3A875F
MRLETFENGTTINQTTALQYLLDKSEIKVEDGVYTIDIQYEGEEIVVTVEYTRTVYDGEHHPIGTNCVFNVVYSTDSFGQNPFSFETLIQDLHDQHLEEVEAWLYDAALKY